MSSVQCYILLGSLLHRPFVLWCREAIRRAVRGALKVNKTALGPKAADKALNMLIVQKIDCFESKMRGRCAEARIQFPREMQIS